MRDETKEKTLHFKNKGCATQGIREMPKGKKKGNIMTKKNCAAVVDPINETITITKAYYKKACIFGSAEYYELRQIRAENVGFAIEFKAIEKKTYKDLTFERMAEYIETQPNSEKQLIVFEAVKHVAEKKGSKYPLTKKWFLKNYPEYKINEVSAAESATLEDQIAAEMDELAAEESNVLEMPAAIGM